MYYDLYQVGKGCLSLEFIGELNDKMKGFYRSKYTGTDGDDRYAAVTQFEVRYSAATMFAVSLQLSVNYI